MVYNSALINSPSLFQNVDETLAYFRLYEHLFRELGIFLVTADHRIYRKKELTQSFYQMFIKANRKPYNALEKK